MVRVAVDGVIGAHVAVDQNLAVHDGREADRIVARSQTGELVGAVRIRVRRGDHVAVAVQQLDLDTRQAHVATVFDRVVVVVHEHNARQRRRAGIFDTCVDVGDIFTRRYRKLASVEVPRRTGGLDIAVDGVIVANVAFNKHFAVNVIAIEPHEITVARSDVAEQIVAIGVCRGRRNKSVTFLKQPDSLACKAHIAVVLDTVVVVVHEVGASNRTELRRHIAKVVHCAGPVQRQIDLRHAIDADVDDLHSAITTARNCNAPD